MQTASGGLFNSFSCCMYASFFGVDDSPHKYSNFSVRKCGTGAEVREADSIVTGMAVAISSSLFVYAPANLPFFVKVTVICDAAPICDAGSGLFFASSALSTAIGYNCSNDCSELTVSGTSRSASSASLFDGRAFD